MRIIDVKSCRVQGRYHTGAFRKIALLLTVMVFIALPSARAFAEPGWRLDVDATAPGFLRGNSFGKIEYGYTDIVPPLNLLRRYRAAERPDGYAWEMWGTELSLWQTAPVPEDARYFLKWHFLYEGAVTGGRGRTGFIFGNPARSNLMSLEITSSGSLRAVMWGEQGLERQGRIFFSQKAARAASTVKIEASYDIRSGTMICRVNDGREILIDFKKYIPSAPITIRGAGFFSAVPEARRRAGVSGRRRSAEYDIDISAQWAKTLHRRLTVNAQ